MIRFWFFDDFLGVQDLVATKRIKKGDEILISYLPANAEGSDVSEIRQKYTKEWYGFDCTCQVCNLKVIFYIVILLWFFLENYFFTEISWIWWLCISKTWFENICMQNFFEINFTLCGKMGILSYRKFFSWNQFFSKTVAFTNFLSKQCCERGNP